MPSLGHILYPKKTRLCGFLFSGEDIIITVVYRYEVLLYSHLAEHAIAA